MNYKLFSLISIITLMITGCSERNRAINTIEVTKVPNYQIADKPKVIPNKKGSLFSQNGKSLFSDKTNMQIGDIVQVVISEKLINSTSDTIKTTKDNSSAAKGGIITPTIGTPSTINKVIDKANGILGIGFGGTSKNSFTGTSKGSNVDKFEAKISALVQQKYQNGNYFIVGTKTMLINGQKQMVKISGIIRPYDIDPVSNSINSTKVANLKVAYRKLGSFTNEIEKPWGSRSLEKMSPF